MPNQLASGDAETMSVQSLTRTTSKFSFLQDGGPALRPAQGIGSWEIRVPSPWADVCETSLHAAWARTQPFLFPSTVQAHNNCLAKVCGGWESKSYALDAG